MTRARPPRQELVRTFPATLAHGDDACRAVRMFLREHGEARAGFVVELVARECVNNAVLHGSRQDPEKLVMLLLRLGRRHVCLRVADQGPGFAWRNVLDRPMPDDHAVRGRGLPILEMYASRLRFSQDGSCVTVWLTRSIRETRDMAEYSITRTDSSSVVTVRGDLTAPLVPSLQASLKQEVEQGARDIVFDLAGTDALDSSGIGLLIAACNTMAKTGGRLSVIEVSPPLLQLLHTMRLVTRLNAAGREA